MAEVEAWPALQIAWGLQVIATWFRGQKPGMGRGTLLPEEADIDMSIFHSGGHNNLAGQRRTFAQVLKWVICAVDAHGHVLAVMEGVLIQDQIFQ